MEINPDRKSDVDPQRWFAVKIDKLPATPAVMSGHHI